MSKEPIEALDKAAKIAATANKRAQKDALYMMWALKRLGKPRPNVPWLTECCERQSLIAHKSLMNRDHIWYRMAEQDFGGVT
nr:MAG TPA: hypothetical protein [Caudoviricetes sp.]